MEIENRRYKAIRAAADELKKYPVVLFADAYLTKGRGRGYVCPNPSCTGVYQDGSGKLAVDRKHNRLHCFSCGLDSDAIGLYRAIKGGLSFPDAVEELASWAGIVIPYDSYTKGSKQHIITDSRPDSVYLLEVRHAFSERKFPENDGWSKGDYLAVVETFYLAFEYTRNERHYIPSWSQQQSIIDRLPLTEGRRLLPDDYLKRLIPKFFNADCLGSDGHFPYFLKIRDDLLKD